MILKLSDKMCEHFKELYRMEQQYKKSINRYDDDHIAKYGEPSFGECLESFIFKEIVGSCEIELPLLLQQGMLRRFSPDPTGGKYRYGLTLRSGNFARGLECKERVVAKMENLGIKFIGDFGLEIEAPEGKVFSMTGSDRYLVLPFYEELVVNDDELSKYITLETAFRDGLVLMTPEEYERHNKNMSAFDMLRKHSRLRY